MDKKKPTDFFGELFADMQNSYKKRIAEKEVAQKIALENAKEQYARFLYKLISIELSEAFNLGMKVFDSIEKTNPCDVLLPFNIQNFNNRFNVYKIPKVYSEDNEKNHHRIIQSTINKIC